MRQGMMVLLGVLAAALLAALPVTQALADPSVAEEVKDQRAMSRRSRRAECRISYGIGIFDPPEEPVI